MIKAWAANKVNESRDDVVKGGPTNVNVGRKVQLAITITWQHDQVSVPAVGPAPSAGIL